MADLWWRLVRFGFRLLYNELAFTYDWVSSVVSFGAWRCWQRTALLHLNVPQDAPVLELAHGTGSLQVDMQRQGYSTIGYDLSPFMGRIAHTKLNRAGLPAKLVRGDVAALPFPDESFAAIVCTFPTAFITSPAVLQEANRVLRPGGSLIIVPGAVFTGGGILARGLEGLYRITGQREDAPFQVGDLFSEFGFTAERVEESCPHSRVILILARKKGAGAA
ncbi:MAG: class I SAM-dependent methyltransferase [Anaerolineaceae bacterium]|nr:class I SAM-dependent methyltransferase [Anaerolineaceae bacterium]